MKNALCCFISLIIILTIMGTSHAALTKVEVWGTLSNEESDILDNYDVGDSLLVISFSFDNTSFAPITFNNDDGTVTHATPPGTSSDYNYFTDVNTLIFGDWFNDFLDDNQVSDWLNSSSSYIYSQSVWQIDEFEFNTQANDAQLLMNDLPSMPANAGATAYLETSPGTFDHISVSFNQLDIIMSPVPIPGAIWLLGSGLIGLVGFRRFKM